MKRLLRKAKEITTQGQELTNRGVRFYLEKIAGVPAQEVTLNELRNLPFFSGIPDRDFRQVLELSERLASEVEKLCKVQGLEITFVSERVKTIARAQLMDLLSVTDTMERYMSIQELAGLVLKSSKTRKKK